MIDFISDKRVGIKDLTVQFTSIALIEMYSYYWQFGDGTTSTYSNPIHTYTNYGYYSVTLSVMDNDGITYSAHKPGYIRIGVLDFSAQPKASETIPVSTEFSNLGAAPTGYQLTEWDWDFGDSSLHSGNTGPQHTYSAYNKYSVTLSSRIIKA